MSCVSLSPNGSEHAGHLRMRFLTLSSMHVRQKTWKQRVMTQFFSRSPHTWHLILCSSSLILRWMTRAAFASPPAPPAPPPPVAWSLLTSRSALLSFRCALCSSSASFCFSPASVAFSPDDWASARRVTVNASIGEADDDGRQFTVTGEVASEDPYFASLDVGSISVTVMVTEDTTPPPKLETAQFADDGGGLLVRFDARTDEGRACCEGNFDCAGLFDYADAQFGEGAYCVWTDARTVKVTFDATATIVPYVDFTANRTVENAVFLRGGVVRAAVANATLFAQAQSAGALMPENPPQPVAEVYAPSVVGVCDDAALDGSLSMTSGTGGRDLELYWALDSTQGVSAIGGSCNDECVVARLAALEAALAAANAAQSHAITLTNDEPATLVPGGTYVVSLKVENYLGASSIAFHTLTKSAVPLPNVAIQGAETRAHYASNALRLRVDVSLPQFDCFACNVSSSAMSYAWTLTSCSPASSEAQ